MSALPPRRRATPLAELLGACLDATAKKRGFATADLFAAWDDVVGTPFAGVTVPERITWPRRLGDGGETETAPATLVVRCGGPAAVFVQHEARLLIDRVNAYLGWAAIGRIKLVQRPLPQRPSRPMRSAPGLDPTAEAMLAARLDGIADAGLREALARLGRAVATPAGGNTRT